jgi:hypothetical protein
MGPALRCGYDGLKRFKTVLLFSTSSRITTFVRKSSGASPNAVQST